MCEQFLKFSVLVVPKKSESADIEEPKLENEGTNEEELNVHISPASADRKSPTSKTSKVLSQDFIFGKISEGLCLSVVWRYFGFESSDVDQTTIYCKFLLMS